MEQKYYFYQKKNLTFIVQKENFTFTADFVQKLIDFSGGSISSSDLDAAINNLQKETEKYYFTSSSESNEMWVLSW